MIALDTNLCRVCGENEARPMDTTCGPGCQWDENSEADKTKKFYLNADIDIPGKDWERFVNEFQSLVEGFEFEGEKITEIELDLA